MDLLKKISVNNNQLFVENKNGSEKIIISQRKVEGDADRYKKKLLV